MWQGEKESSKFAFCFFSRKMTMDVFKTLTDNKEVGVAMGGAQDI